MYSVQFEALLQMVGINAFGGLMVLWGWMGSEVYSILP